MNDLTLEDEAEHLRRRFEEVANKAAFARDFGVPGGGSMIGQHLSGHRPISLDAARAYARGFGISLAEISPRFDGLNTVSGTDGDDGYIRLPLMAEAAAGPGRVPIDIDGEVVRHVEVLESWIRQTLKANPKQLYVLTARGGSMRGVVEDGDVMFVEPCTDFQDDGLYVLTVGDLLRIKRLRLRVLDRQLSIESTDGSAPEVVPRNSVGDTIFIQGRVVGAWGLRHV